MDGTMDDSVTTETLLGELEHQYRRQVLSSFTGSESNVVHIDELVECIDARTAETPGPDHTANTLHHYPFPALADAGFIDSHWEENVISHRHYSRPNSTLHLLNAIREATTCGC